MFCIFVIVSQNSIDLNMVWSNALLLIPSCIFPLHWASCANSVHAIGRFTYGPVPQFRKPALLCEKFKVDC